VTARPALLAELRRERVIDEDAHGALVLAVLGAVNDERTSR
jgi:hypothetical protein